MEHASAKSADKKERRPLRLPLKALLLGGGIGTAVFFALTALAAAALPSMGAKASWLPYISVVLGGLSAFVSSFIAAKAARANGLLLGLGCAVIEALLLGAVLLTAAGGFGLVTGFLCAALLCCGGAGGVFGVNSIQE